MATGRKKIVKVIQTMPFGQVIPKWVETISNLKRHIYRKREQVAGYNKQKDELKTGEALIHVDYSKSYNNTQPDEAQGAYFRQQNFSIFTSCLYYRAAEQDDLAKILTAVISEACDHYRIAAFTCTNPIINELKKRMKDSMKKFILWSNRFSSQFRSKYVFALMTQLSDSLYSQYSLSDTITRPTMEKVSWMVLA